MEKNNQQLVDAYIAYITEVKQLAATSIACSRNIYRKWLQFLHAHKIDKLHALHPEILLEWIDDRRDNGRVKDRTIEKEITAIRSLYEYLMNFHDVPNPLFFLPAFRCNRTATRDFLTVKQMFSLLKCCRKNTSSGLRNYTIIALLWSTGLRSRECCALKWVDIDLNNGILLVRKGKGNKQRQLFLNDRLLKTLKRYRRSMVTAESAPVFCSYSAARPRHAPPYALTLPVLEEIVRNVARDASITTKVTPIILRHTFATHMYDAEVPLYDIKEMMGHNNKTETTIYIHVTLETMRKLLYKHAGSRLIKDGTDP
jgi:integrase/recombinase XerC